MNARTTSTLGTFKSRLKTELFTSAYTAPRTVGAITALLIHNDDVTIAGAALYQIVLDLDF